MKEMTRGVILEQFEVGPMENFIYLVGAAATRETVVIDPAWEVDTILRKAREKDLKITGVLITHRHHDHTNGILELLEQCDVPVYAHHDDADQIDLPPSSLKKVRHGDFLEIDAVRIEMLHTPGHTPGSQCFKIQNSLIAGDTLFINGCGRCDLRGGNAEELYYSLTQKLMRLPDETILYPGHHYALVEKSTMGEVKKTNPFLRMAALSLKDFLKLRMR